MELKTNNMNLEKEKTKLITQLDYAKILIEDNRYGEASDIISEVNVSLENKIIDMANCVNNSSVELPKSLTKTKPNEWFTINEVWYRMKSISKEELVVALNKNNVIKMTYKINKNLKIA